MLILIYVSICYVIFKIFKIPINQWSLATSALGGIIGIALLLLIVNYNHPFTTERANLFFGPCAALGAGPRDRGAGAGQYTAQGRRCAVPRARGGVPGELPAAGEDRRRGRVAFDAVPGRVFRGKVRAASSVRLRPARCRRRAPS